MKMLHVEGKPNCSNYELVARNTSSVTQQSLFPSVPIGKQLENAFYLRNISKL